MDATPVAVTLVGGPTVIIEVKGVRLVTDPTFDPPGSYQGATAMLEKTEGPAIPPEAIGETDAVLLSHDQHPDNFDRSGRSFAGRAKVVLTTNSGHSRVAGNSLGLSPWESVKVGPEDQLTVVATPARHGPPGAERTLGDVTGFVVRGPNNEDLVYVTGDTVYYGGVEQVARRYQPRVVLAFAGAARTRGPFNITMGNNDVLEVAKAFPNAQIVTVHNRGWAHLTEGPQALASAAHAFGLDERLKSLEPGEKTFF